MAGNENFGKVRVSTLEVTSRLVIGQNAEIVGLDGQVAEIQQAEVAPQPLYVSVDPIADSEATTIKQLVEDHNALLAALRDAGVILLEAPDREPVVTEVPDETPADSAAAGDENPSDTPQE
jgi:hypothetical protein